MSDNELGTFLRTRRESVTPAEVGLPVGARRRTPGLRRAEVATLAGVSVEYLTRLEQGRDRHPSAAVLSAIANALRLSPDDRVYLRHLTKIGGGMICHAGGTPAQSVRHTVRALLDLLEPAPALVVNRLGDVLAITTGYEQVAGPVGLLDGRPPNLIRFAFTDPRARTAYPDWDRVADDHAAHLRAQSRRADQHVAELVDELTIVAGTRFTDRMLAPPVLPARAGVERLVHPEVGELRLAYESLDLPDADEQRLIVHVAADDATAAALDQLTGRQPGGLRAVPERQPTGTVTRIA